LKAPIKKIFAVFIILLIVFLYLYSEKKVKRYEFTSIKIGTLSNIIIYSYENEKELKTVHDECLREIDKLAKIFNAHSKDSLIAKINKDAWKKPVKVNTDFENVFFKSKRFFDITDGAFDPGVLPLLRLWRLFEFNDKNVKIPSKSEIKKVLDYASIEYAELENGKVRFLKKSVKLDFGGIAKGYIIDKVADILKRDSRVIAGIVNIGGDLKIVNKNKKIFPYFKIAVKSPLEENGFLGVVFIQEGAIVTSGVYERFKKKNNELFAHIIDPGSGFPVKSDILSVTVIGNNAVDCDALATSFMVLGVEKSKEIAKKENVKILFAVKKAKKGVKLISVNGFVLKNE